MSVASIAEGLETVRMNNTERVNKTVGMLRELARQKRADTDAFIERIENAIKVIEEDGTLTDRDLCVILDGKA